MKKTIYLALTVLLIASALIGCSSASAAKIYGKDDTDISVGVGQTFTIQLEENPTTGYEWSCVISDENVVKLESSEYVEKPVDTEIVGSGGQKVMTFKALEKGSATITVTYERSWEKNPDDETIVYNVTVK